ncbi:MAG: PD-(D/E)XK nuclease family protein, partial [Candidatus Diapherotrites archaeon]|nr:PD-(D/E)XK nuclease family protein [Candidatus Diapherotrites archaeon]
CDYKTNSKMKSQEEADKDRQLALYSLWVRNHFKDARHVVLVWHMLAFNKEMTSERTSEELKKLEKETIELIKEIESTKEFPASVSTLCDYCVYKNYCPSFRHETLIESKPIKQFEKDEGVKLVNSFAVLKEKEREVEEELTLVKDDLILFSKQEKIDVIYGSNKKVSVKEYEKFIIEDENKQKAEELLKKHGLFEQFTLVSWAKLNSQIAEDNIPKDIAKLAKKEKDYRVSLSKKKEEEE